MKHSVHLLGLLLSSSAFAAEEGSEAKGTAIARAIADRAAGYGDQSVEIHMELHDAHGQEATRDIRVKVLEREGEAPWTLIVFDSPRSVKGTALLSHGDDQWLYLPAARRVRRISSGNRSGAFVGSEFSYEDLTGNHPGQHSWKLVGEQACGNTTCSVVETRPRYESSGYTRRLLHVETGTSRIRKIDFFDRKDVLLKTLTYEDYKSIGKHERSHTWVMKNHQNGKRTVLRFEGFSFGNGFSESDFSKAKLKSVR